MKLDKERLLEKLDAAIKERMSRNAG